jgi:hypothetical protein
MPLYSLVSGPCTSKEPPVFFRSRTMRHFKYEDLNELWRWKEISG